jgi:hypothetical protein
MRGTLVPPYLVLFATLMRALWFAVHRHAMICARCGHAFERRQLGEPVCGCAR